MADSCSRRNDPVKSSQRRKTANSRQLLIDMVKYSLLFGAEKALLSRKLLAYSGDFAGAEKGTEDSKHFRERKNKVVCKNDGKFCGKYKYPLLQSSSKNQYHGPISYNGNDFPLNILIYSSILMIKLIGFQISLFTSIFTLPISLSYSVFMSLIFPFQTLRRIRNHLMKRVFRIWVGLCLGVSNRIKAQVNLGVRLGWGLFWAICACSVLVSMLVTGFVVGGLVMKRLVEEPIQTKETLNFDYTKESPVAFVAMVASPGLVSDGTESAEEMAASAIPYHHNLQLTVSLTLPESDYNRKLGVFQVRVEFLSANGKVTASSSYPCMLRYKSPPLLLFETIFRSASILAGFQSEVQILNIKVKKCTEGLEPTSSIKVVLQQRAEYQAGAGIPQIYAASVTLESEFPQFKKIVWQWRRTFFVWISLTSFYAELIVFLILIALRRKVKVAGDKRGFYQNKILWYRRILRERMRLEEEGREQT